VVAVCVSPIGLAQIIITSLAINSGAVACAIDGENKDVPAIRKNIANVLVFLFTKKKIYLVNAFFQSIHLVFHGTAPIWF